MLKNNRIISFNSHWLCDNRRDQLYFLDNKRQIIPNPIARRILMESILKKESGSR
ncbi:MAG: hypothetical protein IKS20_08905 [Victivallales bacterium]|nr:hypothetical protein [Victivallales bacterium]